jgi:hypothetical protein
MRAGKPRLVIDRLDRQLAYTLVDHPAIPQIFITAPPLREGVLDVDYLRVLLSCVIRDLNVDGYEIIKGDGYESNN